MPLLTCPCEEHAPMTEVNRNGVHVDVCTKCKGVWLDRGELEKLLSGVRQAAAEFDREREDFERERAVYRPNPSQARAPEPPRYDDRRYGGEGGEHGGERGYGGHGPYKKKRSWLDAFDIFD